jgi:hypothetical protein
MMIMGGSRGHQAFDGWLGRSLFECKEQCMMKLYYYPHAAVHTGIDVHG